MLWRWTCDCVLPVRLASTITATSPSSTSYLSLGGGFDVGVALLADYVVDVVQSVGGDARKGLGAVRGKVAVRAPRATKISRALDDHGCRPERLRPGREKSGPIRFGGTWCLYFTRLFIRAVRTVGQRVKVFVPWTSWWDEWSGIQPPGSVGCWRLPFLWRKRHSVA